MQEVIARGAKVLLVTNKSKDEVYSENIWETIEVENTEDDLEYRISKFNFSGKLKGKEKDISIDYRHFRFNADSLEKLLHLVLKIKGVEKVNDKNLGSGYTEWYFCSPKQMNAHVLTTIRAYRKILKEKKAKQKKV